MTDAEWNRWQSSWTGATGPLPDVRARARKELRSHRLAQVAFVGLVAVGLAAFVYTFGQHDPGLPAIQAMVLAFLAVMSIGYARTQRGLRTDRAGNPRDALAFLERRLDAELQMAHVVRWAYAILFAGFVFAFPYLVWHHQRPEVELAVSYPGMALILLITFTAPSWVERRNRKHREEIAEWRRWMDEQQL